MKLNILRRGSIMAADLHQKLQIKFRGDIEAPVHIHEGPYNLIGNLFLDYIDGSFVVLSVTI
jgi:hypothetical protein